jgi:hypothetical protein
MTTAFAMISISLIIIKKFKVIIVHLLFDSRRNPHCCTSFVGFDLSNL